MATTPDGVKLVLHQMLVEDNDHSCPKCGADLSKSVESSSLDWSEGLPSNAYAYCETCDLSLTYKLEWEHVLCSARLVRVE